MDGFGAEAIPCMILQQFLEHGMCMQDAGLIFTAHGIYHRQVFRQQVQYTFTEGIWIEFPADHERVNQQDLAGRKFGSGTLQDFIINVLKTGGRNRRGISPQCAMQVVDADFDGEPIGLMKKHIICPTLLQPRNGISANSFIDNIHFFFRLTDGQQIGKNPDVAISQGAFGIAAGAIRDAVTDKEYGLSGLNFKAHRFPFLKCIIILFFVTAKGNPKDCRRFPAPSAKGRQRVVFQAWLSGASI